MQIIDEMWQHFLMRYLKAQENKEFFKSRATWSKKIKNKTKAHCQQHMS